MGDPGRLADRTVFFQGSGPSEGYNGHRSGGGHMVILITLITSNDPDTSNNFLHSNQQQHFVN